MSELPRAGAGHDDPTLDSLEKMLAKGACLTDRHSPLPAPAR